MKKIIAIICVLLLGICLSTNADNSPNGDKRAEIVVFSGGRPHRLAEVQPQGWFYRDTGMLTIEFPAAGFVSYTLSVLSDDVTLNYTVTSPLYRVYVPTDVVEVDLQLETDSGDIFYGSFDATGGTLTH